MSDSRRPTGTVGTFNFIRRIGFPSTAEIVSIFLTIIFLSALVALPAFQLGLDEAFGIAFFVVLLPTLLGETLTDSLILRDSVLTFRRLMGMELLGWGTLIMVLPFAALLKAGGVNIPWQDTILLTIALSLPIRFLTIISLTGSRTLIRVLASLLVPVLVTASLVILSPSAFYPTILVTSIVSVVSAAGVLRLVRSIDREGTVQVGAPPMRLFRAFLNHWLNRDPGSLEDNLAMLGLTDTIHTTIVAFFGKNKRRKGALVVSSFHPGPYRDLGSGGLPSLLKQYLEGKFGGVIHVPHGISGHQSNIITRSDVHKLLEDIESNYPSNPTTAVASRMVRVKRGVASASAQGFDHTVVVTLTMSPVDMEDMPLELGEQIGNGARQLGLDAIVVDAHNSMQTETVVTPEQAKELAGAAAEAIGSLRGDDWSGFKTGFAQDSLSEFTPEDGIGPGGVSVLVVSFPGQKVAYITIDGNNMHPGVREEILQSLQTLGISEGEVMTTDTHLVTGLVRSPLGYYPVGSRLDKQLLVRRIVETVRRAVNDLEDTTLGIGSSRVEVTVLGKQTFQKVTGYIRQVGGRVRNLFYLLEGASIIISLAILAFA